MRKISIFFSYRYIKRLSMEHIKQTIGNNTEDEFKVNRT